jgi:hypothetical protein
MNESVREMLYHDWYGLDGFLNFIEYFVTQHGLVSGIIKSKMMAVLS